MGFLVKLGLADLPFHPCPYDMVVLCRMVMLPMLARSYQTIHWRGGSTPHYHQSARLFRHNLKRQLDVGESGSLRLVHSP